MKRIFKFALLAAVLAVSRGTAGAAAFSSDAVGSVGSDFLNLGVGAKAMGMGGAYTAVAEDASAVYWNPAGLSQINQLSATFMRASYLADITYQYAAYAHRLDSESVIAGSILMTDIGKISQTDIWGSETGTSFNPRDQAYALSYSRAISELSDKDHDIAIGVSAKYITSKIIDRGEGYAADLGLMGFYYTTIPYRLGFAVQNLGRGQKLDQEYDSLPLNIRFGGSASPFRNLLVATDMVLPKGNKYYFTLGSEFSTEPNKTTRVCVRAGLNTQQMRINGTSGISMGGGISLQFFTIDYAYVSMGELGYTHRFAVTFDFPMWKPVFQREDRTVFNNLQDIVLPKK